MIEYLKKLFANDYTTVLKSLIKKSFLVDVRSENEFFNAHVKGSVNIPLNQIPERLAEFEGKEYIVVFCASGMRSSQAKRILESNGFKNVTNGGTWHSVNKLI